MGLTKEKATLAIALGQFIKKIDVALDQVFRLVLVCPVTSKHISRRTQKYSLLEMVNDYGTKAQCCPIFA